MDNTLQLGGGGGSLHALTDSVEAGGLLHPTKEKEATGLQCHFDTTRHCNNCKEWFHIETISGEGNKDTKWFCTVRIQPVEPS